MSKTKEQVEVTHTEKGKTYVLTVPLAQLAHFEAARARGSFIQMVALAEKITDAGGTVHKDRHVASFGGRQYSIKTHDCDE